MMQEGFTLVEVMLATAVLALGLMIISKGMLAIIGQQQNAQIKVQAEQSARTTMDQIGREARTATDAGSTNYLDPYGQTQSNLCLLLPGGIVAYRVFGSPQRLWRWTQPADQACDNTTPTGSDLRPMTADSVGVARFLANKWTGRPASLTLQIDIGPPDLTLLDGPHRACDPANANRFCSFVSQKATFNLGASQ
jgi:prepilin-type N-terminal cleavage/methylation domain-containing protein